MASRLLFCRLAGRLAASSLSVTATGAAKGANLSKQVRHSLQLREHVVYSTSILPTFHKGLMSSACQPMNKGDKPVHDGTDGKDESKDGSVNINESTGNSSMSQGTASQGSAEPSGKRQGGKKRMVFSDSDVETELTTDELSKLLAEKDQELKDMKEKVLRTYAEMENRIERQKRESENSKKFAIQSFSKSLLDVADNLTRALSVVNESISKIDSSEDSQGAVQLLNNLLEGIEMTDKQLLAVFRKFGVEKFDPLNENFDPNRHNAVYQITDASKPPGTVAAVLKVGYMLHDRVLRPAEVGVTQNSGN